MMLGLHVHNGIFIYFNAGRSNYSTEIDLTTRIYATRLTRIQMIVVSFELKLPHFNYASLNLVGGFL